MSAPLAISVAKGEDVLFSCLHQTSQSNTAPVDISTWTIAITIKDQSGNVYLTKSGTVTSGPSGSYVWPLVSADTVSLKSGTYSIDIWRVDSGSRREMGIGSFTVTPDVYFGS